MSLPAAPITKSDGNTGVVAPSATGVCAFVAPSALGTANQPQEHTRQDVAFSTFGNGRLVEYFGIHLAASQKSAILCKGTTTIAAAYGAVVHSGVAGTAVPTAGATAPLDDYDAIVTIVTGGTIGTTGITYTYSLDGGATTSGVTQLGTATTLALLLPASAGGVSSGVSFALTSAQTFLAGDTFSCPVTCARMNSSDTTAALEALRVTELAYEAVYLDEEYAAGQVSLFDSWLAARELEGRFYLGLMNTRHKLVPAPSAESEATFATAIEALAANDTTIRISVGADAADVESEITGFVMARPTALFVAGRTMAIAVGEAPHYVGRGPLAGDPPLSDSGGNPKWHNERNYSGLDDARFTTLRTIDGRQGVYITHGRILSTSVSDYQYIQHARVMNAACTAAFPLLTNELGKAVGKNPPDPKTGTITILEADAAAIEQYVTDGVAQAIRGQVVDVQVTLARDDDIGSNQGATIHAFIEIEALAYIDNLPTNAKFVRSIVIPLTQAVAA